MCAVPPSVSRTSASQCCGATCASVFAAVTGENLPALPPVEPVRTRPESAAQGVPQVQLALSLHACVRVVEDDLVGHGAEEPLAPAEEDRRQVDGQLVGQARGDDLSA